MTYNKSSFEQEAKPFLKWAGGKRQLISQLEKYFPSELKNGEIKRYVEPFIGGGAVFFHLANHYPIKEFFISDINPELILTYRVVQSHVNDLITILTELQNKYTVLTEDDRKQLFYTIRGQFNNTLQTVNFNKYSSSWILRAAQFIFLNRTCFNGLFRVNSKGLFNVPFGRYKNPKICDESNLQIVAKVLNHTQINLCDFEKSEAYIDKYTFVYLDPPYRPISQTANFTSYSKHSFGDDQQIRLASFFEYAGYSGAKLMMSNSDPSNENSKDRFFEELFQSSNIQRVSANRAINSNSSKRGQINELLITNYCQS